MADASKFKVEAAVIERQERRRIEEEELHRRCDIQMEELAVRRLEAAAKEAKARAQEK